jgi:membrane fusion protein, heavy metal efflux system
MKSFFSKLWHTLALVAMSFTAAPNAWAGDGHDHGDAPVAANSNGPQRLPDGSVFLPKPAQRQIGVGTVVAEEKDLPRSIELSGKVVMDPNAAGKVQPTMAGRIEPGPKGLPTLGQAVSKGDVLAYVVPSAGNIERSNQVAQAAELRAQRGLAEKRLARLQELADTVPRKDIEAAQSEVSSLAERLAAIGAGLSTRETLVAPVSGVISSAQVVAGQVVDAREALFEIVDPTRLNVEALAFDASLQGNLAEAFVPVGSGKVTLTFIGASRAMRDQALPLLFSAKGTGLASLSIGQPVKVVVQTKSRVKAVAVPAASLLKNPSNQTIVWVKAAPERFEPRVVMVEPLDGATVAITSGLKPGDRVVTSGAPLVNQIR